MNINIDINIYIYIYIYIYINNISHERKRTKQQATARFEHKILQISNRMKPNVNKRTNSQPKTVHIQKTKTIKHKENKHKIR